MSVALAAGSASAGLTDMTIRYVTDIEPLLMYDANMDFTVVGNENFDVNGGAELLNYSISAMGGDIFQNLPWGEVFVNSTGAITANGFQHSVDVIGDAGGFSGIPNRANAVVSSNVTFTIDEAMDFELVIDTYYFNNDAGSSSLLLENMDTDEQFVEFPYDVGSMFAGSLEAGTYRLVAAANFGGAGYSFNLVPAPSSAMMLAMSGLCVSRRRR
jgi:hypothetical protein